MCGEYEALRVALYKVTGNPGSDDIIKHAEFTVILITDYGILENKLKLYNKEAKGWPNG